MKKIATLEKDFLGTNEEEETPLSGASGGGTGETTGEQTCQFRSKTLQVLLQILVK